MNKEIRVRFAPSPTGPLHIGGVRTALYNYLFAKKNKGTFILRIEDTDQKRFVPGAEEYIINSLKWCGLTIDEGPGNGGKHAPYKQSQRSEIYKKYALQLIESGWAYYAFDTAEELEQKRLEWEKQKQVFLYNFTSRQLMKNQFTMSAEELKERLSKNENYVIRFKIPENETIEFNDIIRENIKVHSSTLDDKVIFKSDGLPTYHLANVVDDHLMEISHVIRGEEWLPSTPLHVYLYKALRWLDTMPEFSHLPLLLKPEGQGKLSKRDGDKLGFPVFPMQWTDPFTNEVSKGYKEEGYLSEAFVNILAFLGWNPGKEKEIYSMNELIEDFNLYKVGKSGTRFDPDKAKWYNHQYLVNKTSEEIYSMLLTQMEVKQSSKSYNKETLLRMIDLVKERLTFPQDFWEQSSFFFEAPTEYDEKIIKKRWNENTNNELNNFIPVLQTVELFKSTEIKPKAEAYIEQNSINFGSFLNCLRLSMVGSSKGPDVFEIIEILGLDESIKRIKKATEIIQL